MTNRAYIYIVEEFDGDNYSNIRVFSSREKAEVWCNKQAFTTGPNQWNTLPNGYGIQYTIEEYEVE